jgi:molecular chaperone DnaK
MHVGIDLGTTYCCVAYIDEENNPRVIQNSDSSDTTPSVIWFDGKNSFVGKKANDRKITPTSPIYEFVKRDIGKPRNLNQRYQKNGFFYGAAGFSAIILRKLKKEAFLHFKKIGLIDSNANERTVRIPAVITVPAYFGDLQRHETRIAGEVAGLDVLSIINEPTSAALAYGRQLDENRRILVFDLGGGTFDVTILEVQNGESVVIASDGADKLGGKDWDELIIEYIYSEYQRITGESIPDDMGWEVQQKALEAKFELTENDTATVFISGEDEDVEIVLYRSPPENSQSIESLDMDEENGNFYFEERSLSLLSLCRTICQRVVEKAGLNWGDLDDIVMAGGSCRMPMIPKMLEELSGQTIQKNLHDFSFDTSIAIGAAIYGSNKKSVKDVTSKTIGIEVQINEHPYIEHLIKKNSPLPASISQTFKAQENAVLKVYEGDSVQPDECILRGRLELENQYGSLSVSMIIDEDGVLTSVVEIPPDVKKELKIQTDDGDISLTELKEKIASINIRL